MMWEESNGKLFVPSLEDEEIEDYGSARWDRIRFDKPV